MFLKEIKLIFTFVKVQNLILYLAYFLQMTIFKIAENVGIYRGIQNRIYLNFLLNLYERNNLNSKRNSSLRYTNFSSRWIHNTLLILIFCTAFSPIKYTQQILYIFFISNLNLLSHNTFCFMKFHRECFFLKGKSKVLRNKRYHNSSILVL